MNKMPCSISDGPAENPNEEWPDPVQPNFTPRRRLVIDVGIQIQRLTSHRAVDFNDLIDTLKRAQKLLEQDDKRTRLTDVQRQEEELRSQHNAAQSADDETLEA